MIEVSITKTVARAPGSVWAQKILKTLCGVLPKTKQKQLSRLAIFFVGEQRMQTLNRSYHGTDRVTDVLAFPSGAEKWPQTGKVELGDVVLCLSYIDKQARRFGVSAKQERARMLIHGVLHLLGYDHVAKKDAKIMFSLQEKALERLG